MSFVLRINFSFFILLLLVTASNNVIRAQPDKPRIGRKPLIIKAVTVGPTQEEIDAMRLRVDRSEQVRSILGRTKFRLMSFEYERNNATRNGRYRAVFYDYTNDRTFVAEGGSAAIEAISLHEDEHARAANGHIVPTNSEEVAAAQAAVQSYDGFAAAYRSGDLKLSRPMPPVTLLDGARLVNVGIEASGKYSIVGVNFKDGRVVQYEGGAPPTARAAEDHCGIVDANDASTANGTAGQAMITIEETPGQTPPLWQVTVVRPSASSGNANERSGVEIRNVMYKGKSVLKRGHVPLLNVSYTNTCGPYRDWQWEENSFSAPATGATDPAAGIRILANGQIATTSMESGTDTGNFRGVAVYRQDVGFGSEVVMVSEMEAGWYRYIMEWRFATDGTIRPRFGFGAVDNACTCISHHHHAHWRFDFDVVNPSNKIFQIERGRKFLKPITDEVQVARSLGTNRRFVIQNSTGNEAYSITPGLLDGNADAFGVGDFWLLRFAGTADAPGELDDPGAGITSPTKSAQITAWLTGESLVDQDVVVWYVAHFRHENDGSVLLSPDRSGEVLGTSHVVGPDLRAIRW